MSCVSNRLTDAENEVIARQLSNRDMHDVAHVIEMLSDLRQIAFEFKPLSEDTFEVPKKFLEAFSEGSFDYLSGQITFPESLRKRLFDLFGDYFEEE